MSRPYSEMLADALSIMNDSLTFWREKAPGLGIPQAECHAQALLCEMATLDMIDDSLRDS
jgi:hypothetical protein